MLVRIKNHFLFLAAPISNILNNLTSLSVQKIATSAGQSSAIAANHY